MNRFIASVVLSSLALLGVMGSAAATPAAYPNSERFQLNAEKSGRTFDIFVSLPATPPPPQGYSVIYTLDGNAMYGTMTDTVRAYMRRANARSVAPDRAAHDIPPTMVVAIGYSDTANVGKERAHDLTPFSNKGVVEAPFGGANDFLAFIKDDLKPAIAKRWKVNPQGETLFGHSFGGLFVLHTLFTQPELFDNYVAASASIWWGNKAILKEEAAFRAAHKDTPLQARLLMTAGQYEEAAWPILKLTPQGKHITEALQKMGQVSNGRAMAQRLAKLPGFYVRFDELEAEDHGTVVPVAVGRAVQFVMGPQPAYIDAPAQVPGPWEYVRLTPQQRYDLRLLVRTYPEKQRKEFLRLLEVEVHSLPPWLAQALHDERNAMDKVHKTKPVK